MNEFNKIIGYEKEKEELKQICDILKRPEAYAALGIRAPKGVLLEGVPGVGKTLMAWALINASGLKYFHCKKDKPDGEFVKIISKTFEEAKENAPTIIFLDDIDKFAETNSRDMSNQEEFVAIQTGMETIKDSPVLVLATANDIGLLPESLKRSGRFDKIFNIEPPSRQDATKIIEYYLSSKKVSKDVNAANIAKMIHGHSCADLENILNEAGIYAVYNGFEEIQPNHITKAIVRLIHGINLHDKPVVGEKTIRTAYHEAGHTVMAILSKSLRPAITTICRCREKLGITIYDEEECNIPQITSAEERIRCALAGKICEEIYFPEKPLGSGSDNAKAYELLEEFITRDCMEGYRHIYFRDSWENRISPEKINRIEAEITQKVIEYSMQTKEMLLQNKPLIEKIANLLIEKSILSIDDFENIF